MQRTQEDVEVALAVAQARELREKLRARMERSVAHLIAALDAMDAAIEDLEPQGDEEPDSDGEPSIGWSEPEARTGRYVHASEPDLEQEFDGREPSLGSGDDREGDESDWEPSLGSLNGMDQGSWADGYSHDLEDEHDGREPDEDFERSNRSLPRPEYDNPDNQA